MRDIMKLIDVKNEYLPSVTDKDKLARIYPFNLLNDIFDGYDNYRYCLPVGLEMALDTLTKIEKDVILWRYRDHLTFREAGFKMYDGRSLERARQVTAKALRKLKRPSAKNLIQSVPIKTYIADIGEMEGKLETMEDENKLLNKKLNYLLKKRGLKDIECDDTDTDKDPKDLEECQALKLKMSLQDLDFSVRTFNCLARAGINTLADIVNRYDGDLLRLRNFGKKSFQEVVDKVESLGFKLREKVPEED